MEEIFMHHSLQFGNSLKDLKCLREQLYSAAEHFESSFAGEDHKQTVLESSRDYVAQALVNTVDHLGSVADKLNRFLDQKTDEFSHSTLRFSCIRQRLSTLQGFMDSGKMSEQSWSAIEAPKHHKKYTIPDDSESLRLGKFKFSYRDCISTAPTEMDQPDKDILFSKAFQATVLKQHPPSLRKGNSRINSSEISPLHLNFAFAKVVPKRESGKRSASPLGFPSKRTGPVANRSVSPSPCESKQWFPRDSKRAVSVSTRPPTKGRETEIESYTKKSKHMFKAFLNMNRPRKQL